MPIHLEYIQTLNDYLDALRVHAKRSFWLRVNWTYGRFAAPIFGALFIVFGLLIKGPGVPWILTVILMACGLYLVAYPFYGRWRLQRCYMRSHVEIGNQVVEFDDTHIRMQGQSARSEFEWSAVHSFAEDKKVFLLYLAPARFVAIPKRICGETVTDELRSLLRDKIGSSPKAQATT